MKAGILSLAVAALLALPATAVVVAGMSSFDLESWQHLLQYLLPRYVGTTTLLLVGVISLAALLGCGGAWLVVLYDFPGRRLCSWAAVLPFTVPSYLAAYAYVDYFQVTGPLFSVLRQTMPALAGALQFNIRSLPVAVIIMSSALAPYVYLACVAALRRESPSLLEAARTLGRDGWTTFWKLGVPLLRPALAAGGLLVALEVLNDFGTVDHFALDTMATGLFRVWYGYGDKTLANQLAIIFFLLVVIVMLSERMLRGRARFATSRPIPPAARRLRLRGVAAWAALLFCAWPVMVGFIGPLLIFLTHLPGLDYREALAVNAPLAGRSLLVALMVATVSLGIAAVIAWAARPLAARQRSARLARIVATAGYALPGGLIAVGVLQALPVSLGMLTLLIYAHLVRFSGIAVQSLDAGHAKVAPSLEMAARTLGAGTIRTYARVYAPLLMPAAIGAWLLVFVDTLKELPAAMILRPFDFDLLPVHIHNLASDERLDAATLGALLLVLIGIPPILWLHGRLSRDGGVR